MRPPHIAGLLSGVGQLLDVDSWAASRQHFEQVLMRRDAEVGRSHRGCPVDPRKARNRVALLRVLRQARQVRAKIQIHAFAILKLERFEAVGPQLHTPLRTPRSDSERLESWKRVKG